MFFPVHVSCLTLMEHLCHSRQAHLPHMYNSKSAPADLEAFCDVLRHRREKDDHPDPQDVSKNHYHGRCGGLEWQHSYYGARQSWGGEWDNEEGGEVCISIARLSYSSSPLLIDCSGSVQTLSTSQICQLTLSRKCQKHATPPTFHPLLSRTGLKQPRVYRQPTIVPACPIFQPKYSRPSARIFLSLVSLLFEGPAESYAHE